MQCRAPSSSRICLFASHTARSLLRCVLQHRSAAISRAKSRQLAHLWNFFLPYRPTPCTFGTHRSFSSFISSQRSRRSTARRRSKFWKSDNACASSFDACLQRSRSHSLAASLLLLLLPFSSRKSSIEVGSRLQVSSKVITRRPLRSAAEFSSALSELRCDCGQSVNRERCAGGRNGRRKEKQYEASLERDWNGLLCVQRNPEPLPRFPSDFAHSRRAKSGAGNPFPPGTAPFILGGLEKPKYSQN